MIRCVLMILLQTARSWTSNLCDLTLKMNYKALTKAISDVASPRELCDFDLLRLNSDRGSMVQGLMSTLRFISDNMFRSCNMSLKKKKQRKPKEKALQMGAT